MLQKRYIQSRVKAESRVVEVVVGREKEGCLFRGNSLCQGMEAWESIAGSAASEGSRGILLSGLFLLSN